MCIKIDQSLSAWIKEAPLSSEDPAVMSYVCFLHLLLVFLCFKNMYQVFVLVFDCFKKSPVLGLVFWDLEKHVSGLQTNISGPGPLNFSGEHPHPSPPLFRQVSLYSHLYSKNLHFQQINIKSAPPPRRAKIRDALENNLRYYLGIFQVRPLLNL